MDERQRMWWEAAKEILARSIDANEDDAKAAAKGADALLAEYDRRFPTPRKTEAEGADTSTPPAPGLREALEWYAAQVALCCSFTPEGDRARSEIARDGGEKARAALRLAQAAEADAGEVRG